MVYCTILLLMYKIIEYYKLKKTWKVHLLFFSLFLGSQVQNETVRDVNILKFIINKGDNLNIYRKMGKRKLYTWISWSYSSWNCTESGTCWSCSSSNWSESSWNLLNSRMWFLNANGHQLTSLNGSHVLFAYSPLNAWFAYLNSFMSKARELLLLLNKNGMLSRFVIDESHCISSWGSDLRTHF